MTQGSGSSCGDSFEIRNSAGSVLFRVDPYGNVESCPSAPGNELVSLCPSAGGRRNMEQLWEERYGSLLQKVESLEAKVTQLSGERNNI